MVFPQNMKEQRLDHPPPKKKKKSARNRQYLGFFSPSTRQKRSAEELNVPPSSLQEVSGRSFYSKVVGYF